MSPQISEHLGSYQHTFTLLYQKPSRQRGQARTSGSKSSASPRTLEFTTAMKLLQEHREHHQLREARVRKSVPACWVGHLASDSDLHHWKVFLEEHPATHVGPERGLKAKRAGQGLLLIGCPAPPGLLAPHHGSVFPWKLRTDPESCNPAVMCTGNTQMPYQYH